MRLPGMESTVAPGFGRKAFSSPTYGLASLLASLGDSGTRRSTRTSRSGRARSRSSRTRNKLIAAGKVISSRPVGSKSYNKAVRYLSEQSLPKVYKYLKKHKVLKYLPFHAQVAQGLQSQYDPWARVASSIHGLRELNRTGVASLQGMPIPRKYLKGLRDRGIQYLASRQDAMRRTEQARKDPLYATLGQRIAQWFRGGFDSGKSNKDFTNIAQGIKSVWRG